MKMSNVTSIHEILDKDDWNLYEFKTFLEQDASSINEMGCSGSYPLLRLLENEKCSVDMVKLFLQYGADINFILNNSSKKFFFFMCKRGGEICRIFWEKIINSNLFDKYFDGRSPLCVFLNTDFQPDIIKRVLNTERYLNVCKKHVSPLHCAMMCPNTRFKVEMCQILIEAGQVFGMNIVSEQGQSFLCYALRQGAGQDLIKLFLKAGCPLNACKKHVSALHCTLYSQLLESKEIYEILIEAELGSYLDHLDSDGQSFLCNAMSLGTEPGAIKLLLEKGYRLNTCRKHASELHCATRIGDPKYKVDVFQLLIEAFVGADLNVLDVYGQTPICKALQHGAEPEVFKLLLNAGCLLSACRRHDNHPLFCATMHSGVIRTDTLQLLIDAYAPLSTNAGQYNYLWEGPMRCALKKCIYETDAIKLLYNFERDDNYHNSRESLLHIAVKNRQCCKPSVVQFLIDKGDFVCAKDDNGKNSLQLAIENNCEAEVIRVLLMNANMNCCQSHGNTNPMQVAIHEGKDAEFLEVMLKAGAPLTSFKDPKGSDIMLSALIKYYLDQCQERIDACKLLLKYIYLENSKFKINSLTCRRKCYKVLSDFAKECVREIKIMESNNIGYGYTLYEFIRTLPVDERQETHHRSGRKKAKTTTSKKYDLNKLCKILADNGCHLYTDSISAKISSEAIKTKLTNMSIYTARTGSNSSNLVMRIVLNRDCISKIAELLSDEELLRLILAFYVPEKQIQSRHSEKEKKCVKRKSEQPTRLCKRKQRRL